MKTALERGCITCFISSTLLWNVALDCAVDKAGMPWLLEVVIVMEGAATKGCARGE